jgi:hypothetical protein
LKWVRIEVNFAGNAVRGKRTCHVSLAALN